MQGASDISSGRSLYRGLLAAAALGTATGASAGERGWHVGTMLESTSVQTTNPGYDYDGGPSNAGYSLHGGLRLNNHLAVDFGWQRHSAMSKSDASAGVIGLDGLFGARLAFDASVVQVAVVGIWPFGAVFDVYGRAGIGSYRLDGTLTLTDQSAGTTLSGPTSANGTGGVLAIGVGAMVAKAWHVSLEYQSQTVSKAFFGVRPNIGQSLDDQSGAFLSTFAFGIDRRFGRGQRAER